MSPRQLDVLSARGAYPVRIGSGLLAETGSIAAARGARMVALVTDENVGPLLAAQAVSSLEASGIRSRVFTLPAGERAKSWTEAGRLVEAFSERGIARDDMVVALGGGVVGDVAGFCASVYMRGLELLQLPTTLLAQVDSSIGGKTGVDLPRGKNLAGSFWPPVAVLADTDCLETLADGEWRSGMAEVVKSAILDGEESVAMLERRMSAIGAREASAVEHAVAMAAGLKVRIVSGDEREGGAREALNYGHTLGHAIEKVAGFGAVPHGVAVAEGIRFAARLAESVIGADPGWTGRQDGLLDAAGLVSSGCRLEPAELLSAMRSDKKTRGGEVRFVLSGGPGVWQVAPVGDSVVEAALARWCRPGN